MGDPSPMPALNFNGQYAIGLYNSGTSNMYGDIQGDNNLYNNQKANRVAIEAT
jgi:hypothetical protein